jgi:Ig-like domain CHU_C associated
MRLRIAPLLALLFLARLGSAQCTEDPRLDPPQTLCPNVEVSTETDPTGIDSYSWSLTNGTITGDYGHRVYFTIWGSAPAVLTLTATYPDGCAITKSATINVAQPLSVNATASAGPYICYGQQVTLTANVSGGDPATYQYQWSVNGQPVPGATAQTFQVAPTQYGYYSVSVSDYAACGNPTSNNITLVPYADVFGAINGASSVCPNQTNVSAWVDTAIDTTVNWTVSGAPTWNTYGTAVIFTAPASGSVTVTADATDAHGCTKSATKTISVDVPTASINANGPTTFCAGGSVTLTANSGASWSWSTGESTQSINVSQGGTYTVTVANATGCTASASKAVNVLTKPTATVSGGGGTCGGSATISAALTGTAPFTVLWSDGVTQTTSGSSVSRQVAPAQQTVYSVSSVTDAHCTNYGNGFATVVPDNPPAATVGGSATICAGQQATLLATLNSGIAPWSITWSDGYVQSGITGTTVSRNVFPAASTTYTVTSLSDAYCSGTATGSAVITVNTAPTITTQPRSQTVRKNSTVTLTVAASSSTTPSYQWYRGASGDTSTPVGTGSSYTTPKLGTTTSYWVRVTNSCGSTNSNTATITIQ